MSDFKNITKEDKLFYLSRSFFTLDGLWMIETEKESDWETALKIDLIVWIKLMKAIIRRLKRYLKIETNTLSDLLKILTFRWSVEGWDYEIKFDQRKEIIVDILTCPYKAAMERNPERQNKIPLICKDMCLPFYEQVIREFNDGIKVEREIFLEKVDANCRFRFPCSQTEALSKANFLRKEDLTVEDKLFYFERNFTTLDGLWMIETENELGFERALKLDIIVWQLLYKINFRRLIKYLTLQDRTLQDLLNILFFCFEAEGYDYEIIKNEKNEALMVLKSCPYIEAMERNPERRDKMAFICKDMCIPFFIPAIEEFNPKISLKRSTFIGLGDSECDFHFILKE
ncbi:MAG: DUF6125 family protein [Promethearchaeota archaeon]